MPSVFENLNASEASSAASLAAMNAVLTVSGTLTTVNGTVQIATANKSTAVIQVTGTYTGTISVQGTLDGTNWFTFGGSAILGLTSRNATATIPSATPGIYQVKVAGLLGFRIIPMSTWTGTANVIINVVDGPVSVNVDTGLPTGSQVIGLVGQSGSWNLNLNAGNTIREAPATTTTFATITTSSSSQILFATTTTRRSFILENTGTNPAIISFSGVASSTTRTFKLAAGAFYEANNTYTGAISVIQDTAGSTVIQGTSINV